MEQKEAESKIERDILVRFIAVILLSFLFAWAYTSNSILMFVALAGLGFFTIKLMGLAVSWGIVHARKYD